MLAQRLCVCVCMCRSNMKSLCSLCAAERKRITVYLFEWFWNSFGNKSCTGPKVFVSQHNKYSWIMKVRWNIIIFQSKNCTICFIFRGTFFRVDTKVCLINLFRWAKKLAALRVHVDIMRNAHAQSCKLNKFDGNKKCLFRENCDYCHYYFENCLITTSVTCRL